MVDVTYANPEYLWLLWSIPLLIIIHLFSLRHLKTRAWRFANFEAIQRISGQKHDLRNSRKLSKNLLILMLKLIILVVLIMSATGLTFWYKGTSTDNSFVLLIDSSASMLADDYDPNRFVAAKKAAISFVQSIQGRAKIGVVSFSGTSKIESPLSENKIEIIEAIENIRLRESGGTDIADALITGANVLATEANSTGSILLLSDGVDTGGTTIQEALDYVMKLHYTIDAIGMGTAKGGSFLRIQAISKLNNETLTGLTKSTDGQYYQARSEEELEQAYLQIAQVSTKTLSYELQLTLLLIGLGLILFEWGLINTRYRTLP